MIDTQVSIPFIAGQWSLPRSPKGGGQGERKFQSPSLRGSGRFMSGKAAAAHAPTSFNPLHCGAVVASKRLRNVVDQDPDCFNPLHCGAVVASRSPYGGRGVRRRFQSPSLRGSGRFGGRQEEACI